MDDQKPMGRRRFLAESLTIGGIVAASAAWAFLHRRGPGIPREWDQVPTMGIMAQPERPSPSPATGASPGCGETPLGGNGTPPQAPREQDHVRLSGKVAPSAYTPTPRAKPRRQDDHLRPAGTPMPPARGRGD